MLPENITQIEEIGRWGKGYVLNAVYTPDGSQLVVATPLGVYVYDAETAALLRFMPAEHEVTALALSPDGQWIVVGYGGSGGVDVYLRDDGTLLRSLETNGSKVFRLFFLPDGQTLIANISGNIFKWDVNTGQQLTATTENELLEIAADGETAVSLSSDFHTFQQWQNNDGLFSQTGISITLDADMDWDNFTLSPDGNLLAISEYWGVHVWLWSIPDQTLLHTFDATPEELAMHHRHRLAKPNQFSGPGSWYIGDMAFSPDGQTLAVTSGFHEVTLWQIEDGSLQQRLWDTGLEVAFSPDGKKLASWQHTLQQWDLATGSSINSLSDHVGTVRDIAFVPGRDMLAIGSDDGSVYLRNLVDGGIITRYEGCDQGIWSVAVSPDGSRVIAGSDSQLCVWNLTDNASYQVTASKSPWGVSSVAISGDGQYAATVSNDDAVRLWQLSDGTMLQEGYALLGGVVTFSPVEALLVTRDYRDNLLAIWRVPDNDVPATRQILNDPSDESTIPESIGFSPDGKLLALGSNNGRVLVWRIKDGSLLYTLDAHRDYIRGVAFSPDGQLLATASFDQTIKFWRVADGALLHSVTLPHGILYDIAFSPDGRLLAVSSLDGTVRLWGIP